MPISTHSTGDIIDAAERNRLTDQIMFTVYPQRWTDDPLQWTKELALQNAKNINKRFIAQKGTKAGDRKPDVRGQTNKTPLYPKQLKAVLGKLKSMDLVAKIREKTGMNGCKDAEMLTPVEYTPEKQGTVEIFTW